MQTYCCSLHGEDEDEDDGGDYACYDGDIVDIVSDSLLRNNLPSGDEDGPLEIGTGLFVWYFACGFELEAHISTCPT